MKNRNKTKINQTLFEKLVKFFGLEKAEKIFTTFGKQFKTNE